MGIGIRTLLSERIDTLFGADEKQLYATEVWDMLVKSYQKIGGVRTWYDEKDMIEDSGIWKLVFRGDVMTAVRIYKDKHGRKTVAMGSDGTVQGKKDVLMLIIDDLRGNRSWGEASGAVEHIMTKYGAVPVPNVHAQQILGKQILALNSDGYHYTRLIGGEPKEKVILVGDVSKFLKTVGLPDDLNENVTQ